MMIQIKNIFIYLFLLIPLFLITGPALPDLTITFGVIFGLLYLLINNKNYDIFNKNIVRISIFFWLSLILISFFSFNKVKSFQDSIIFIRFLLIPVCCYFIYFVKDKSFNYLLLLTFILIVFVSIDTLYQFFNYTSHNGFGKDLLGFQSNWYGRLTGPFRDELIPGSYLSKFGLIGYVYLMSNNRLKDKIFIHSTYLGAILVVCFASGERMAFATFLLALISLLLFLKNFRLRIFISLIIGLLSILIIYKHHPFYNDYEVLESNQYHQGLKVKKIYQCETNVDEVCSKIVDIQPSFLEILKNFKTSAYGEIYSLSIEMFKNNPLTGVGLNNFNFLCENFDYYRKMMVNYNCTSHPHNTYIQFLSEGGVIVFVSFILYLIFNINFILNNNGERNYKIISLTILLILFWPIMSTGSLIKNWYGISVFFIIGICLCLSRFKTKY